MAEDGSRKLGSLLEFDILLERVRFRARSGLLGRMICSSANPSSKI